MKISRRAAWLGGLSSLLWRPWPARQRILGGPCRGADGLSHSETYPPAAG